MEVASLVIAIIGCITSIPGFIAYFEAKSKEKEEFKHALENTKNRQLFEEFVSKADGNTKLFRSTFEAYNYCNKPVAPQCFTDKEKELEEHTEWFEKGMKGFTIRESFYKKYGKIILDAIAKDDNDGKYLNDQMVENAKKNLGRISITV